MKQTNPSVVFMCCYLKNSQFKGLTFYTICMCVCVFVFCFVLVSLTDLLFGEGFVTIACLCSTSVSSSNRLGLENPFPKWLTHMAGKLVLDVSCTFHLGALVLSYISLSRRNA